MMKSLVFYLCLMQCSVMLFTLITFPVGVMAQTHLSKSDYDDFNHGQTDNEDFSDWIQAIQVLQPSYRSDVKGVFAVKLEAKGMTAAKAFCWSAPDKNNQSKWGYDVNLTPEGIKLDKNGKGTFEVDADMFPSGPMNIRIYASNEKGLKDLCELQLYNVGGVKWNQGIPSEKPVGARDMDLVYFDDFDGPLSISNDGRNAKYNAHKPRFGDFSGWPFSDVDGQDNPFEQRDTYLKIKARKRPGTKGSTGLIASVNMDGEGLWTKAPFYMECRLTAQSAIGTWPAFWTITGLDRGSNGDELDIIEAYGGVGKGNPNHTGYAVTSHFWGQKDINGNRKKEYDRMVPMMEMGGKSFWSTTFHTYGLYVGKEETIYYFDDMEVLRHPTNDVSYESPHVFLINYAIGGISGWPIDLERYGNGSDMYVDYVRIYAEKRLENYSVPRPEK